MARSKLFMLLGKLRSHFQIMWKRSVTQMDIK